MTKKLLSLLIATILIFSLGACSSDKSGSDDENKGTVKLAYVNWAEGIAMTNLAAAVLEEKLGYEVKLTMADVAPVFTSLASGDSDAFLDVWLPITHEEYIDKYGDDMVDLGISYENARLALVVPSYVDIDSIEELNDNKDLFDGQIIGIDPGAGLMGATERAIEAYDLDYNLMAGSGSTMTAALSKAINSEEPIVVTGWAPHWKFARWDLKMLEDPKGSLGEIENIHKYSRIGLEEDMPEVTDFLKKFKMTEGELGDLMGAIEDDPDTDPKEVASQWMNDNSELIESWLSE